jgi:hypothetical protein
MDATLSQRYLLAVSRSVPEQQRDDVERELAALMADQVDDRIAAGEDPAAAERAVVEALGDPDALAAGYVDRPLWLVGPRYFLEWKRLLVLLLWIVPPFAAAGAALGQVLSGAEVGAIIGQTVVVAMGAILHVCFWTTLVFALLERSGARTTKPVLEWTPDRLPMPRATGAKLSDLIASVVFVVLLAGLILWDLGVGFVPTGDGDFVSVLNGSLWPLVITILFVIMAAEVALAIWVFLKGRWTIAAAVVNTVLALAAAGVLFYNLGRLINPAAVEIAVASGAESDLMFVLQTVTGFFIGGIAIWDIIDGFLKARRSR